MKKDIILFFKKVTLFILPIIGLFVFSTIILHFSKETILIKEVIEKQKDNKELALFGLAYSNPDKYYKLESIIARNPEVLALGTSRVMQFRSKFFKNNVFFNGGGVVGEIGNYNDFIDNIQKDKKPKIIIIGLDQYFFNPIWYRENRREGSFRNFVNKDSHLKDAFVLGVIKSQIYKDFFNGKINFHEIIESKNQDKIGLSAIKNNNGFRNDGSYYYGKIINNPRENEDYGFKDTFSRIENGTNRFEYGNEVSESALNDLEKFLKKCKEKDIYIIGFMPPYAHAVYEKMFQSAAKYGYVFRLEEELKPLFKKYDFDFYNFTDLASLGASDSETIDGFHGSEKAYLRLHIKIAEKNEELRKYSEELAVLKKKLNESSSNYMVFSNSEY